MATITKGKTFGPNDNVANADLHTLVDSASVSGIVNADIAAGAAIVDTKLAQISTAGKVDTDALTTTSEAQGDVMYHNGTKWTRLGVGTSGQFLKTQGAAANPTWANASVPELNDVGDVSITEAQGQIIYRDGSTTWVALSPGTSGQYLKTLGAGANPAWDTPVASDAVVKAWVSMNGTGTIAINDSYNVSGITDNGTGDYTISWDTDFANTDYATVATCYDTTSIGRVTSMSTAGPALGTVRFECVTVGAAAEDVDGLYVMAIGDQ